MREQKHRLNPLPWPVFPLALWGFVLLLAPMAQAGEDGKSIYVEQGCNKCHSILAEGIEVVEGGDEEEAEEGDDPFGSDEGEEAEPEDLSGIGASWEHGADGLEDWLMKKLERDGSLHQKKFKGTKKEVKTLAAWLMTLTKPAE